MIFLFNSALYLLINIFKNKLINQFNNFASTQDKDLMKLYLLVDHLKNSNFIINSEDLQPSVIYSIFNYPKKKNVRANVSTLMSIISCQLRSFVRNLIHFELMGIMIYIHNYQYSKRIIIIKYLL